MPCNLPETRSIPAFFSLTPENIAASDHDLQFQHHIFTFLISWCIAEVHWVYAITLSPINASPTEFGSNIRFYFILFVC